MSINPYFKSRVNNYNLYIPNSQYLHMFGKILKIYKNYLLVYSVCFTSLLLSNKFYLKKFLYSFQAEFIGLIIQTNINKECIVTILNPFIVFSIDTILYIEDKSYMRSFSNSQIDIHDITKNIYYKNIVQLHQ